MFSLRRQISNNHAKHSVMSQLKERNSPAENIPPFINENGLNILLVEDNKANQFVIRGLLKKYNFQIDISNNGLEALNALEENKYDIVLMDIQMPVMDGIEATKQIRDGLKGKTSPQVPIIAITAHARDEDHERGIKAGMNDYVTKPVNRARLLNAIFKQFR